MGYGGKYEERQRARQLRAESWTLQAIADELGVAKGTVSVWVRDVEFTPLPRNRGHPGVRPHPLWLKKEAELDVARREALATAGSLSARDRLVFGAGLYLGEGAKTERSAVRMANTSPVVLAAFVGWLREFFEVDDQRLRARIHLHEGLDETAAVAFWSDLLVIPPSQFQRTRTVPVAGAVETKHRYGCATVIYSCLHTHRRVMALVRAIASPVADPG